MAIDDLMKGLGAFQEGMTKFGVTQGIAAAQEQVNQLQGMQLKEMEKRQAMTGIANNLVMQLSSAGADPNQVAQVAGTIMPTALKNSNDFLALGASSGDKEVTGLGQQLLRQENAVVTSENAKNRGNQMTIAREGNASAEKIAGMKADSAAESKERLPATLIKPMQESLAFGAQADSLLKKFESDPKMKTYLGLLNRGQLGQAKAYFNKDMKDFRGAVDRYYLQFRKSMTGSAAGVEEDAIIRNSIANLETNPEAFAKLIRSHLDEERAQYEATTNPLTSQGYSIKGFEWKYGQPAAGDKKSGLPSGIPEGSVLTTRKTKDGQLMKVYKAPSGDLYRAE